LQGGKFDLSAVAGGSAPEANQHTQDQASHEGELGQVKNDQRRASRHQAGQMCLQSARRVVSTVADKPDDGPFPCFRDFDTQLRHAGSPLRIEVRPSAGGMNYLVAQDISFQTRFVDKAG
jgi:hypothetical protein